MVWLVCEELLEPPTGEIGALSETKGREVT